MTNTTTATATTITQSTFDAMNEADQKAFLRLKGEVVGDKLSFEDDIEEAFDAAEEAPAKTSKDFDIDGPAVFGNIIVQVGDVTFNLKGYKVTEMSACKDDWDKDTKTWGSDHMPTMSLIDMIREYGSETFNRLSTCSVSFRVQGDKTKAKVNPMAALLAAERGETLPEPTPAAATETPFKETEAVVEQVAEEPKQTAEEAEYAEFLAFKAMKAMK